MRGPLVAGGVLLGASLLLNAALLIRISRCAPGREPGRGPQEPATLTQQLAGERGKNATLAARIRELESGYAGVRSEATPPRAADHRGSGFREKVRRYLLLSTSADDESPEQELALSEASVEFKRASVRRAQDKATFAECLAELFEAILQDKGMALSPEKAKELGEALDDFRESLVRTSSDSVLERTVFDLQSEAAVMQRVREHLSEDQGNRLREILGAVGVLSGSTQYYAGKEQIDGTIVDRWTSLYRLDEAQRPAATSAVRTLADTIRLLKAKSNDQEDVDLYGSAAYYTYRIRTQEAQLAALKLLENVMTPGQVERMRSLPLTEFHASNSTFIEETPPLEK